MGKELFEREQEDLLSDLKDIPRKACDRRVRLDSQDCFLIADHIFYRVVTV
jgi:hypothetical protein